MSKVASYVPNEPEPEKPKTWEEQVSDYRNNYRSALKLTATVLTLPLKKVKAVFKVAVANK
jgi:hypothetical protein